MITPFQTTSQWLREPIVTDDGQSSFRVYPADPVERARYRDWLLTTKAREELPPKELLHAFFAQMHKRKLSHVGSCLTALPIIYRVYANKRPKDEFVLSNGHAARALYAVLEHFGLLTNATRLPAHPERCDVIPVSTGSLGMGVSVALGLALADRSRDVHCLLSDGECSEGVVWESLLIKDQLGLDNLKLLVNANGFSGYGQVNVDKLESRLNSITRVSVIRTDWIIDYFDMPMLKGLDAHYRPMCDRDLEAVCKRLNDA